MDYAFFIDPEITFGIIAISLTQYSKLTFISFNMKHPTTSRKTYLIMPVELIPPSHNTPPPPETAQTPSSSPETKSHHSPY